MTQPIRVLLLGINYSPEPTGIAPYTTGIADGLRDRGHEVSVITTYPHYPDWRIPPEYSGVTRRVLVDGIPVTRVRHYVPAKPHGVRRLASELSFGIRCLASRWAAPDVLLLPSPALVSSAISMVRVRGSERPSVGVIVQDLYSAGLGETVGSRVADLMTKLESHTLRRADEVAVIHERFRNRVVSDLGVDDTRVNVIRNWTHIQPSPAFDRAAFRAGRGWRDDEFVVLHTGAMGDKQDLRNVVDAARIADQTRRRVRFVLIGDGGQRPALEQLGHGVERLEFGSPVAAADYPKLLRSADLLLVNERAGHVETAVPSKLTSYFSSGRPILAATERNSTTADEIADSGAGWLTPPGDPVGLLAAVHTLATSPGEAEELGSNGPKYCANVCSEAASLDAYDAMVRRLANAKNTREKA